MGMAAASQGTTPGRLSRAIDDIVGGLGLTHVWALLGLYDIKQRYRRSTLGPFWLTISMAVMIGAMGFLYARLFNQDPHDYLPYLAAGLLLWTFISTGVTELCLAFIGADTLIKQVKLPLTVHVSRVIWRNFLILGHNAVILVPVALWAGKATVIGVISALVGVLFLASSAVLLGLILGIICTRFRDIPQIVSSVMQLAFFLTPILWRPEVLGDRVWLAQINPLFHYIEIVRGPIISGPIPFTSWMVAIVSTLVLAAGALLMLGKYGRRVAYWV